MSRERTEGMTVYAAPRATHLARRGQLVGEGVEAAVFRARNSNLLAILEARDDIARLDVRGLRKGDPHVFVGDLRALRMHTN